jgi:multimeric flavodoxin WrbA
MRITIIDGDPDSANNTGGAPYRTYLSETIGLLAANGHDIRHLRLAEMTVHLCTGCWSCWVKTPGRCPHKDDTATVIKTYLDSDLVLFATPLRLGFVSALMKAMLDKIVALFLPHIEIYQGEFIHSKRYETYPALGCLLHPGDFDEEDAAITTAYFQRYAFHFQTALALTADTTHSPKEVSDAIGHL